jgi:Tfp pilus assembly protein PilV
MKLGLKKRKLARLNHFTLLEVLVSSCIIAIFLGVLLAGFSTNMQSAQTANNYIAAIQMAQFKFNSLLAEQKLKESDKSGREGRYKWRSIVKETGKNKDFLIKVEVFFYEGNEKRSYVLESLALRVNKKKPSVNHKKDNKSDKKPE